MTTDAICVKYCCCSDGARKPVDAAISRLLGLSRTRAAGRFVPYFFYAPDGSIGIEQLDMRPEAGTDSWYDRPLREDRSLITPPYLYPVNGA